MWIAKEGDVRKQELLDAAFRLFCERGYEKTSINDIIAKVGVTKGAFYYYFKSKEEIMECIASEEAAKHIKIARTCAKDTSLDALGKLNGLIRGAKGYNLSNAKNRSEIYKMLEMEENARVARRIQQNVLKESIPLIQKIIEQGINEGVFSTDFPEEAAELYIYLSSLCKNSVLKLAATSDAEPMNINVIEKKLSFYQQVMETMLGAKKGSLKLMD